MFLAGEDSGDQHAARVLAEIQRIAPGTVTFGYGGRRMEQAGMELLVNLAQDFAIIGISQVVANYPKLRRLLAQAGDLLRQRKPDALVLVDYPGFNLRLAKIAKSLGIPVVYYISPQIWAWHKSRLKSIAETVDQMLVILPFEVEFFKSANVKAEYVGHPLCDNQEAVAPRGVTLERLGIPEKDIVIGLIPGSRRGEIERHLTIVLEAARLIRQKLPNTSFVIPRAATIGAELIEQKLKDYPALGVRIAEENLKSVRAAFDFAICKSGTSTLELAMVGVPMVVIYRVSLLTLMVAKAVLKIPYIGLVNIVAGREVAPELLQDRATPAEIAGEVVAILGSPERMKTMRAEMDGVRKQLGGPGASKRAACSILEVAKRKHRL